jgi:Ca2+-binding EF-hand superfamily protein
MNNNSKQGGMRYTKLQPPLVSAEEIQRLYKRFMKLDKDNSGSIDKDEFLSIPQIANNPLASRMIAIFDEDGGGDVDFHEFIKGLSAFSARGNKREKLECKCGIDRYKYSGITVIRSCIQGI